MTAASPGRPQALPVLPDSIPAALKAVPQWVVWRYVEDVDADTGEVSWDKPPVNARTGGLASSTDPGTWSDYETALAAYQKGGYDGVGFVLHRNPEADDDPDGLVGVDVDKCRDPETGEIEEPWRLGSAVPQELHRGQSERNGYPYFYARQTPLERTEKRPVRGLRDGKVRHRHRAARPGNAPDSREAARRAGVRSRQVLAAAGARRVGASPRCPAAANRQRRRVNPPGARCPRRREVSETLGRGPLGLRLPLRGGPGPL